MRARKTQGRKSTFVFSTAAALVVMGAAFSARAADDPFEEAPGGLPAVPSSNVVAPSQQAPASAPAGSEANFPTGLVERLPSSAYPEPVIRGLYGGSLWLDMQGHQWPNYQRTGVGVSGYGWVDTDYKLTRIGDTGQSPQITRLFNQARFALRLTPTFTNGSWFVQAQAELIANVEPLDIPRQTIVADTDDLWVRTGVWNKWDVTVGRFEGFSVYHLGMGLDLNTDERNGAYDQSNTPPQPYLASYMYYRPPGTEFIGIHIYAVRNLRVELLAEWGNDGATNRIGGRPAAILDMGMVKVRAAAEYQYRFATDPAPGALNEQKNRGFAVSAQFVLAPWLELGPNFGRAITDVFNANSQGLDTGKSGDIVSFGGFVNARPLPDFLIGLGANYASFSNLHTNSVTNENDKSTNTQYFVALQYLVNHQLFVKVVGGYAKSNFDFSFSNVNYYDDMLSVRVRLMYLY
jgi:hypothetical protein